MMLFKSFFRDILKRSVRQNITQFVRASYAVIGSYMIYKMICIKLNVESVIVCVLSGSMEPGFKRGDILFIKPKEYYVGDIVVFQIDYNSIPIVHRVTKRVKNKLLTKGDNNSVDDVGLYKKGRTLLEPGDMRAAVFGYVPFFGYPTIWISTVPGLQLMFLVWTAITVFYARKNAIGDVGVK